MTSVLVVCAIVVLLVWAGNQWLPIKDGAKNVLSAIVIAALILYVLFLALRAKGVV